MFIVEAGVCVVRDSSGRDLLQLTPTMFFGELALLRNEVQLKSPHQCCSAVYSMLRGSSSFK